MIRSTQITRLFKFLPLCEETFGEEKLLEALPDYKAQSKAIIRTLGPNSEPKMAIESGIYNFYVLIDQGIVYLCCADRICSQALIFFYLETLARTFYSEHGDKVEGCQRPYAFLSFEHEISGIRKSCLSYSSSQISQLSDDLSQAHNRLTKSIEDILRRGEKIDRLADISSHLISESKKYASRAQDLHWDAMYEKYGTPLIAILVLILFLYIWWYWF